MAIEIAGNKTVSVCWNVASDDGFFASCFPVRRDVNIGERKPLPRCCSNLKCGGFSVDLYAVPFVLEGEVEVALDQAEQTSSVSLRDVETYGSVAVDLRRSPSAVEVCLLYEGDVFFLLAEFFRQFCQFCQNSIRILLQDINVVFVVSLQ